LPSWIRTRIQPTKLQYLELGISKWRRETEVDQRRIVNEEREEERRRDRIKFFCLEPKEQETGASRLPGKSNY